ncbi:MULTISPECIES: hypothetical protein [Croceitalea]|uniref:Lipoprotein n=1 Tax=Croceitalea vernalis TaxID=3075599 RepID=A0ABU3BEG4_9FLAO|nr:MULTISPECIES: hypothetical protein [unclassified Croceitalea]MDT0538759.1 hypothetical protein [Croceitalea sp. P059]MDT0620544.1 hypothetical protein [Croceitalea sp. P007]
MKVFTYSILALVFSLSACSSQKKLVENPPFELGQATCQTWQGGRAETGSGINLEIPLLSDNMDEMKMQQAYFRGMIADVSLVSSEGKWMAKASFKNESSEKMDMVMHADSKQEVGNQPPTKKEKFPFELGTDQCVVSYMDGEKIKYYKIEGIKEQKPLIYK